jgi:hypothetical protein
LFKKGLWGATAPAVLINPVREEGAQKNEVGGDWATTVAPIFYFIASTPAPLPEGDWSEAKKNRVAQLCKLIPLFFTPKRAKRVRRSWATSTDKKLGHSKKEFFYFIPLPFGRAISFLFFCSTFFFYGGL